MKEKIAIVTGASKGMGLAVASKLAKEGYFLGIMSRGEDIHIIGDELNALSIQGSTDSASDLEQLISQVNEKYGRIDVLVNNTGHAAKGDLLSLTDDDWYKGMNLLLMNVIRSSRMIVPVFQKQGNGTIVNISTFGAVEPSLSFPISSVMRSGVGSYTKLFAAQYASQNIRMNNVLPGFIDSYGAAQETIDAIPAKRQGTTSEIADVVSFLCGEKSSYVNGQSLLVDGGLTKSI